MQYDKSTSARVDVTTHIPGKVFAAADASRPRRNAVSLTNGAFVGMQRTVTVGDPGRHVRRHVAVPYAENSYTFFTGECGYACPTRTSRPTPTTSRSTNTAAALLADPAKVQPQPVTVRQPPFNIRVKHKRDEQHPTTRPGPSATASRGLRAAAEAGRRRPRTATPPVYKLTTMAWPASGWGTAPRAGGHWVSQARQRLRPGPAVRQVQALRLQRRRRYGSTCGVGTYDNTTPDGTATPRHAGSTST